jgi:predicted  nucleic acid-binding Zn-ribbon protein
VSSEAASLQQKLKALVELQKVDLDVAALRKSSEVYPKQMAELERELGAVKSSVEMERTRVLDVERQRRTLEQNIADEKEKVKKWEARLAEQRSTREYAALAREIDIAKKANQTMSDELVELGKSLGSMREALKSKESELLARQEQIAGQLKEIQNKVATFQGQVKELEGKRAHAAGSVDKTLLGRYDNVRRKKLPVLVTVTAGTCAGCNMNVPPQLYNNLRVSLGIDVCPNCHRIICAAEALAEQAQQ